MATDEKIDPPKPKEKVTRVVHVDWEEVRNIVAWIIGAAAVVLVAWAPVKCSMDSNEKVSQAIEGGANPIDAACAYTSQSSSAPCIVRAAVGQGKAK